MNSWQRCFFELNAKKIKEKFKDVCQEGQQKWLKIGSSISSFYYGDTILRIRCYTNNIDYGQYAIFQSQYRHQIITLSTSSNEHEGNQNEDTLTSLLIDQKLEASALKIFQKVAFTSLSATQNRTGSNQDLQMKRDNNVKSPSRLQLLGQEAWLSKLYGISGINTLKICDCNLIVKIFERHT
ncbi:unnamed protein product [Paramecium octaurelia]|uniref:Uncharacterized protein n=1 Tax=Paramecium octaurelia TaxID=43137 RepID=A0A8S1XED8_PAROT|nr:unnamed protein product [Paramecium octaurelia]